MDLVNRLKFFLEENKIAISQFADKCRIPRPTLSQILNGRNKKISDELISKIHEAYPDLSVLWLMFGEGDMVTRANTRTSEAENSQENAIATTQPANQQTDTAGETAPGQYADENPEKTNDGQTAQNSIFAPENRVDDSYRREPAPAYGGTDGEEQPYAQNATVPGELNFVAEYEEPAPYGPAAGNYGQSASLFETPDRIPADSPARSAQPIDQTTAGNPGQHPAQSPEAIEGNNPGRKPAREAASIVFTNTNPLETPRSGKPGQPSIQQNGAANPQPQASEEAGGTFSVPTLAGKKITNIVVFYSDNSFQSFSPTPN